jgi:hypothetical protein
MQHHAMGRGKDRRARTSGRGGEYDPADENGDEGADFEQPAPDLAFLDVVLHLAWGR